MKDIKLRRIFVVPREGLTVIDLETNTAIPAAGGNVLDNKYNRRRILDGDLIETDAPKVAQNKNVKN